jgi:hypothetical protein
MNANLDICFINTVSSNYTWDDGAPIENNPFPLNTLSAQSSNSSGLEYVCCAPYTSLILSSTNTQRTSSVAIKRTIDFGDYYNTAENVITVAGSGVKYFSHVYFMPGLYTITLTEEEYVIANNPDKFPKLSYSQSSPVNNNTREIQTNWHWRDYKNIKETNFPATWQSLKFQNTLDFKKPTQLTWFNTKECLYPAKNEVYWQWNNIINDVPPDNTHASRVTWNQTISGGEFQKTWNSIVGNCNVDDFILSGAPIRTVTKEAIIRIKEVSPVAYLSGNQPPNFNDRHFPLTVRLTPRYTQSGSFPIEKIVWDLGDGSPLLTRRRWENGYQFPFVYNGALSGDYKDPRNFDVVHTYDKKERGQYTFYPSITAYASSTGASDYAATVIGPIKAEVFSVSSFVVNQNHLSPDGALLLGEIENTAAVWKVDN